MGERCITLCLSLIFLEKIPPTAVDWSENMLKFILKKMALMIPMLLIISLVVFLGLRSTDVDPITFMVSPEIQSQNPELVEQLREELGLNDGLMVQYVRWLGQILKGDLGYTFKGESIADILAVRLP